MPTRNVSLTEELDRFITERVASGRYENASEVVRAALRSLEYEEEDRAERAEWLRQAMAEGEASGIARGDVFAQVKLEARRISKTRLGTTETGTKPSLKSTSMRSASSVKNLRRLGAWGRAGDALDPGLDGATRRGAKAAHQGAAFLKHEPA